MKSLKRCVTCLAVIMMAVAIAPMARGDRPDVAEQPRVLTLLGKGFLASEFYEPYYALRAAGYEVDVASNAGETVPGNPAFSGAIGLEAIRPDRYAALFVPGGGSPKNLEQSPRSVRIVKQFDEAGKLVTGLCHGSRLLMQAGVMNGRTFTGVWLIKDELPRQWRDLEFGAYVDEPTVMDGNMLTSRCPWDAAVFTKRLLSVLQQRGELAPPQRAGSVLVVRTNTGARPRFAFNASLEALGSTVKVVDGQALLAIADEAVAETWDALVICPPQKAVGEEHAAAIEKLRGRFAAADRPVHTLDAEVNTSDEAVVAALKSVIASLPAKPEVESGPPPKYGAVMALMPGFDGRTASAMAAWLRAKHERVAIVAPEAGWLRGMNGTPMQATHRYAEPPALTEGAMIVMPGGFWPHSDHQDLEKQRINWVVDQHKAANAHVVALGLDTYELIRLSDKHFEGATVTGTDQVDWSIRNKGVTFKLRQEVAHAPEQRLTTGRGFESISALWEVLEEANVVE